MPRVPGAGLYANWRAPFGAAANSLFWFRGVRERTEQPDATVQFESGF